jgi:GntR family phosphonate transport system transcriptional regulator
MTNAMTMNDKSVRRRDGVALWRQISDQIRLLAGGGELVADRLPTEMELASRFGVNRHTVRSAIAQLVREGFLRSEQGRGTFVVPQQRLSYPITARTRFSAGLDGQASDLRSQLVRYETQPADANVAAALNLDPGKEVIRIDTVSLADGAMISVASHWFEALRFAGLAERLEQTGSITASLAGLGISDYTRRSTTIVAMHALDEDLNALRLGPGAIVLLLEAINVDPDGRPIQFSRTRFSADKVSLFVETPLSVG